MRVHITGETLEDSYKVIAAKWKERREEISKMKKEEGYEE